MKTAIVLFAIFSSLCFFVTRSYPLESIMASIMQKVHQNIDVIDIQGNGRVSTQEISALFFETNAQDKVVLRDKKKIIEDLLEIPLIKEVRFKYIMPSKMIITITEREPMLFYYDANLAIRMVDSDGSEFYDARIPTQSLVFVRGVYRKNEVWNFLKMLKEYPVVYENVTEIEYFFGYRFNIVLNNKLFVALPEEEDRMKTELQYLVHLITKRNILKKQINKLDLRNVEKVYIGVDKNNEGYVPEVNRVLLYKTPSQDEKYEQVIRNAIEKV